VGKAAKNIFDEKVSLIYEYNKKSPLFARKANAEIFVNNVEKAVEILQYGLQFFPDYPSAHIILAKAYMTLGKYDDALRSFKIGCGLINSETSYQYFVDEVALYKKQRSAFEKNPRQTLSFENDLEEDSFETNTAFSFKNENTFEDHLGELAEKISAIKLQPPSEVENKGEESDSNFPSEVKIASETLAKIYVAQGEFLEAIEMYRRLILKNPLKENYFLERIAELQAKYALE